MQKRHNVRGKDGKFISTHKGQFVRGQLPPVGGIRGAGGRFAPKIIDLPSGKKIDVKRVADIVKRVGNLYFVGIKNEPDKAQLMQINEIKKALRDYEENKPQPRKHGRPKETDNYYEA